MKYDKDPQAVLDYVWDWSNWLTTGDTISTATVTVATGDVVLDSDTNDDTTVTAWVSGGTVDTSATVTAQIVTAQGRTDERTITLWVRNR